MDPVSGTTLTYNGIAAGPGFLGPKLNAGTLVLGGVNTYSGATIIDAGTLSISADANLGTAPGSATPGSLVLSGGTLVTTASFTLNANRGITLGSTGGTINPAGGTTLTYNGIVAGTGGLGPKTLSGTLVLGGVNTYSGATIIDAGTLSISADVNLGTAPGSATPGSLVISGGTLATTAGMTLNANRGINLGVSGGTIDVAAGTILSYNGVAAGTGGLAKIDSGTLVLGGINTYSGATTISAGILSIVVSNVFGNTSAVTIAAGSELDVSGGISVGSPITAVSGTGSTGSGAIVNIAGANTLTGLITLAGNTTIGANAGQLTLSGVIGDNSHGYGLTLVGGGTFVFSGGSGNTYAGATTLVAGTLELSKTVQIAIPAALIIGNGVSAALVQETLSDQIYNSATVTVNNSGTLDLNNHNDAFFGIVMTGGTVQSGTGILTLYGNVMTNASSTTAVISGNLALSNANGPTQTFAVASGTVPNNGPDLAISASISGNGGITKTGAGTLTLSNTNTYTGATIVNAGTLLVNGSQSASAVTVNRGAILGGTNGTVGTISVAEGGTVSPGAASAGSGILNSGNVSFVETAAYNVNLNGTTVGSAYDELNVTGTVTIDPSSTLNVTLGAGFTPAVGNTFVIIQSSNAISERFASLPEGAIYVAGGYSFQVSYKNNEVTLTSVAATTTTVSSSLNPSIYGQSVTFTATVSNTSGSGGVPSGSVAFYDGSTLLGVGTTLSGAGTSATSTFTISTLKAGTQSMSAVYTATGNPPLGSTSSTLTQTVNQAPLTITANNQTKIYGAALPTLTASYSGFVNGDTAASLDTQPTLTTTATAGSHVAGGPYTITASGAVDSDYSISYVAGTLTVTSAGLTITAVNQTKVYGAALPTLTASYSGFVNGDTSASLTTQPTLTTTATASSHVSGNPYSITASGAVDADYTITYVAGSLTVTAAPLTITAE